jgi:hypothetical protein
MRVAISFTLGVLGLGCSVPGVDFYTDAAAGDSTAGDTAPGDSPVGDAGGGDAATDAADAAEAADADGGVDGSFADVVDEGYCVTAMGPDPPGGTCCSVPPRPCYGNCTPHDCMLCAACDAGMSCCTTGGTASCCMP